jgi:thiol:disulfide interchange protein DsbD
MRFRLATAVAVLLCLSPVTSVSGANPVVSIRAVTPAGSLTPGKPTVLTVELAIANPYHINSDHPLQDYLIPTTLEFEPQPGITFGKTAFPAASIKKLPVSDSPMAVYEGIVKIAAEITPASSLAAKEIVIRGRVRYQACNDRACLPPVRQTFSMTLPVAYAAPPSAPPLAPSLHSETFAPPPRTEVPGKMGRGSEGPMDFGNKGLLATFLLVFLGGLALNLTPCVYPMIPITISYFGGQAQGKKGSLIIHSSLYVIGMAVTYSILGVAAAMTGGLFGAANQYPPVLIGIALVMVLLALSMFDVYELRMPAALNRLAGGSQKGFWGTFLMGLTVGIVAAPCIGPFVFGLLTYVGNRGNAVLGFALFFILALGLGIPFLVLGIFSGSIRRLPRSGAWMVWVRKIFGFILLAMAVYFVKNLLPSPLAYYLALALIMLLAGIYMAWIDPVPAEGRVFPYVRNVVGIVFFSAALYAALTGLQGGVANPARSAEQNPAAAIQWQPYSEAMLDRASREYKPVFIDFYADWCAPCKELDAHTFSAPEVVSRSRDFIMLKVDLTSAGDPQAEILRQKYQAIGVPTLVFLKPDGQEIPDLRGTGFESKEILLDKMNRAIQLSAD